MNQKLDPFKVFEIQPQATEWLPFGSVKPKGWLFEQIRHDLVDGFVGQLDQLVPELIIEDDIYGRDRLTSEVDQKELGTNKTVPDITNQHLWWNSETQSNWWDGLVRSALLVEHPEFVQKAKAYVDQMLAYQDDDGYLGIYAPELRYNFASENGELWAQASQMRVLLGYYEATSEPHILEAVKQAVQVTMEAYPIGQANPFLVEETVCGPEHGLMFTDVLDRLYQLTGQESYLTYAHWLYEAYSKGTPVEKDIQYNNLMNPDYRFQGHGAHTYEHPRALLTAIYASNNPLLEEALGNYLTKLEHCLTPSGGPIGDEWVYGRHANPDDTGYEYCSLHELHDSYSHLLQKTGNLRWADRMEWLLFNAAQGSRHPHESSIAYLNTDNVTSMMGTRHPDENEPGQNRYKYSPAHQDMAVCCAPNAGRIYPYYVRSMWLKTEAGLTAALYGPSIVKTEIDGIPIEIEQVTEYPFDLTVELRISTAAPVSFAVQLRKPTWCANASIVADGVQIEETAHAFVVHKSWQNGDVIQLSLTAEVIQHTTSTGQAYFSRGPLLYARPLVAGQPIVERTYPVSGFRDLKYNMTTEEDMSYLSQKGLESKFSYEAGSFDVSQPWLSGGILHGQLLNGKIAQLEDIELRPLGSTILRQLTFPRVS